MNDSKAIFDYWHSQVRLKNLGLVSAPQHIETHRLRHDCTNYDDLRNSREVQGLDEPDRSRVIAVIKYECTAQVLQRRAGILKDRVTQLQTTTHTAEYQRSRLLKLVRALQEKLFGKDRDIQKLQTRISVLEAENETLRAEAESEKAHTEVLQQLEQLQKEFQKVSQRKQQLAKNNQRLGGRVAHTNRFRQERDEARAAVQALRQQLAQTTEENQLLREENETLRLELVKFSKRSQLGIVEIHRNGYSSTQS